MGATSGSHTVEVGTRVCAVVSSQSLKKMKNMGDLHDTGLICVHSSFP